MKRNTRQLKIVYTSFFLFLFAIFVGFLVTGYRTRDDYLVQDTLASVTLDQEMITVDGGEQKAVEGRIVLPKRRVKRVILTGYLTEDILTDQQWMMRALFLDIVIKCNGQVIYDNHMDERQHADYMQINYGWESFTTTAIPAGSQISIEATGTVGRITRYTINTMRNSMQTGKKSDLIFRVWQKQRGPMAHGVMIITIGLCVLLYFAIGSFFAVHGVEQGITLGFLIIVTGFWYLSEKADELLSLLSNNIAMLNYMCYGIFYVVPLAFSLYAAALAKDAKLKEILYGFCSMVMNYNAIIAVLIILGKWDLYGLQWTAILIAGFIVLSWTFVGMEAWMLKDRETSVVFATLFPGAVGGILQTVQFIARFENYHAYFATGMLISLLLQIVLLIMRIAWIRRRENEVKLMEQELADKRMTIMISQIQPHFMFNALGTIKRLYDKDAETAKRAMEAFTKYLRSNIDSLSRTDLISFETEKNHLDNYFFLEKLRFQERVKLVYDTKYEEFFLPALTLQPIVENAIKHGITERREGGTIWLTTKLIGDRVQITIRDNGVGFDTSQPFLEGSAHVGIENVRSRVEHMCHGTFEITSRLGEGTRVIITLPIV